MMKRFIAVLMCAIMLCTGLIVGTSAATDVEFSVKGASGKPDDTVSFDVYIDKNNGIWSGEICVYYDNRYFSLVSYENGTVFKKSEVTASPLTAEDKGVGCFTYFAALNNENGVTEETGLFVRLNFQILKVCPNGNHEIKLVFPNDGVGWFIVPKVDSKGNFSAIDKSVSCTNKAYITVSGSDATVDETTDENGFVVTTRDGETTAAPVTDFVTDDSGKLIKNEDGSYETYVVTDKDQVPPKYEYDSDGNPVTDDDGVPVTEEPGYVKDTTGAPDTTEIKRHETEKRNKMGKAAVIVCIAVAAVAAVVIIIVIVKNTALKSGSDSAKAEKPEAAPKKPDSGDAAEKAPETDETQVNKDASDASDENKD